MSRRARVSRPPAGVNYSRSVVSAPSTEAGAAADLQAAAPPRRRPHPSTVAALLLIGALSVWHAFEASQHLLTDRDPGVYVTTGRWLAREGSLLVEPAVGPFAGHPDLRFEEQGWNLDGDGRLQPQFLHLLPAVLAVAHRVGGDRLLLLTPVAIAGVALLAFHLFAVRVVRPWWALVATTGLAVSVPWVHLSRDAFSETLVVLLLFAGLALLWDASAGSRPWPALASGLLLGAVAMARVEGFVILLPLAACVAVGLARARRAGGAASHDARRTALALVVGTTVPIGLAIADLVVFGSWYLDDLGGLLLALAAALAVVVVAGVLVVAAAAPGRAGGRAVRYGVEAPPAVDDRSRRRWAAGAALAVLVLAGAGWFVRPAVSTVTGPPAAAIAEIEEREGLGGNGVRRYSEHSVEWLAWYLGPVTLAAGIAGSALVVHRLVGGRDRDLRLVPFLAVAATISALYLWRPSIVPDHVWVMRRFAIVTIPAVLLLAALLAQHLRDRSSAHGAGPLGALAAGALATATVAFPLVTLLPVAGATTQEGMLEKVREVCSAVGADGALVVLPGRDLDLITAQTVRSFCGVPVAVATEGFRRRDVAPLADAWAAEGRVLHLLGDAVAPLEVLGGGRAELVTVAANDQQIEATLTERPDELVAVPFAFVVVEVTQPAGG